MLKALWRVAPVVLFSLLAIWDALVFFRAIVLSSRSSLEVHARRFLFRFAIGPLQMRLVKLSQYEGWLKVWARDFHT